MYVCMIFCPDGVGEQSLGGEYNNNDDARVLQVQDSTYIHREGSSSSALYATAFPAPHGT